MPLLSLVAQNDIYIQKYKSADAIFLELFYFIFKIRDSLSSFQTKYANTYIRNFKLAH